MKARQPLGFTLLELSIVLVIIALVTGMAIQSGISVVETARLTATQKKMKAIEDALMQYRTANDRLPCPADLTLTPGSANYGLEAGADGASIIGVGRGICTGPGIVPHANFTGTGATNTFATAAEGALPAVSLGLPPDFMYDGWGNQFRYAVDISMTAQGAFPKVNIGCTDGAVTVNDANGNARSTSSIYALISHGANGHGAYTRNGVTMNASSVNVNELTNCHCNSSATATAYAPTYVQMQSTLNHANSLDSFDDLVSYKERWQMGTDWDKAGRCVIVYVADRGNSRVQMFNSQGVYQGQFGSIGTGNGQFTHPYGIAVDSAGNVWVTDYDNDNVQKFTSTGTYISQFGGPLPWGGTGNGQFIQPTSIAFDASGNILITDKDNHRIQKFNSSGNWLMTIGGDAGDGTHTCTQCASTSSCTCYSGTGNGQFTYPNAAAFATDGSGNIWVADSGNARLQEFSASGTWLKTVNLPNWYDWPFGMTFDPSGNFWTTGNDGYQVDKYNNAGTLTTWLDQGYGYATEGSDNGLNYNAGGVGVDKSGNIWMVDYGNNRIQEFDGSGNWIRSVGGPPPYACETSPSGSAPSCAAGSANGQFDNPAGLAISSR